MIRNRRIGLSDAVIERSQAVLLTHHDDSDVTSEVEDALEDWRSLASMETVFSASSAATSVSNRLARIFVTFLECADSSPELLIAAVRHRAGIAQEGDLERISTDLTDEVVRDLAEVPRFPEEQQVLERLIRTAQDQSRQQPRLKILVALLGELRDSAGLMEPPKTLVFASSQVAACALAEQLSSVFGRSAVSRHLASMTQAELEADIHCFRHKRDCFVLVCDRSAEEGRNFQFATHLVHFDLPWQPNRLEQRIGRVDRISRVRDLTMHVMINATSGTTVSAAWYDVLRTGLGIFGNSIASLQFYVDAKMPMLCLTAFRGGAHSLREAASTMNADIVEERLRLDEQAAIDEIDAHDTNARTFFEALDRADSREEELKKAVESWLIDVLRFERHLKSETPRVARYTAPRNALVPADILRAHFTRHLDKAGTFHRTSASRNPKLVLHRLGGGLLDSLVRFSAWDDRGRVFAIWRHDSDWPHEEGAEWIGFRFSFVVVPDTTEPRRMLAETRQQYTTSLEAINRRAEALCPPRAETVFVDIAMNEVVDSGLLARLKKPFKKIANGGSDYNLTKQRVHLIDTVIPPEMWEMKCREARHAAEKHMVERAGFQTRHEKLAMEASRRLLTAVEQIATRERLNRSPGAESVDSTELTLERELGLLLVAGIRKPRILVDSVGFIVISGRVPGTAAQPSAS
jgi:ATP-dependent helicase HepA